jgi:isoleucyl-tRNA synthetase
MYCPHCETPLAKAEIAADNTYKDITEEAVTVKFKVRNSSGVIPNGTNILAWTTTPWTLPGNVALAVGGDIDYALYNQGGESYLAAQKLLPADATVVKVLKGGELVGLEYEPLFDIKSLQNEKSHRVYRADFVSTDEGTGIVHTAVMYGEDDFVLGQKEKLPMVQMLNPNGTYNDILPEFLRGKYIKDAERDIKKDLEARGILFKRENHTHSYPHCWRCGTPLIYNAVPSWFINIQKVKAKMLSENEKVNWVPEHLKHGRFHNIVENAPDWTISRNRFWASPLPIWKSKEGKVMVIGSLEELKRRAKKSGNTYFVMRHGEAENTLRGVVTSEAPGTYAMTEKGNGQVRDAIRNLVDKKIDLIFVSPVLRTQETAAIVANELKLPKENVITDERVREQATGTTEGRPIQEHWEAYTKEVGQYSRKPEGGESAIDVKVRMGDFLSDLEKAHQGKNILIISHGGPIWALKCAIEGASRERMKELHDRHYPEKASVAKLDFAPIPVNANYELDLHRPYTDSIVLIGDDGAEYTRIPEVVDCWVESGSMPFAEYHYPFENKAEFEKRAPGDFIAEYIAQTRTWFYYMHAIGVLLFGRRAFKNVVSTGNLLAADGAKISKSKRNYTDPLELINRYGSDAVRLYLMSSPVMQAEDVRFRDEDVRDQHNRVIGILWNTFKFFDLYQKDYEGKTEAHSSEHVLDRWILARLDEVVQEVTAAMDAYDTPRTSRAIRAFVDEYSTWYVRRSRERMKSEWHDKQYALATEREVLLTLAKLIAPIAPFIAESMYRGIEDGGSVHLESWPETKKVGFFARLFGRGTDDTIISDMAKTRAIVSKALEARDKAGIKVRQPLAKLTIANANLAKDFLDVIRDEVNVKSVEQADVEDLVLDTNLTPELKEEGIVRESVRAVQDARKKAGLKPGERDGVSIVVSAEDRGVVEKNLASIAEQTNTDIVIQ